MFSVTCPAKPRLWRFIPGSSLEGEFNANQFAVNSPSKDEPGMNRHNLGFAGQVTLNIPVWNWGATRSKVVQADLKRQQAELDVTQAQRTLQSNLESAYREARGAQAQLTSLKSSLDLSA